MTLKCTYFQVALPLCEFKGRGGDEQSRALCQVKLPSGKEKDDSIKRQLLEHTSEGRLHGKPGQLAGAAHSPILPFEGFSGSPGQVVGSFQLTYRV